LAREIKKESDGQKSRWKFFETLSYMKEDVLRSLRAKEDSEWTENETEQLIEYYKQNYILWNHSLSSYRDRNLKELSYTKLSELLPGRSYDDIKNRWNVLKTIFNREVKKEEDSKVSGTGTDAVYTSQWKYLDIWKYMWIESQVFTPRNWCVYKQPIQTNNDLEGWHNALNCRAGGQCGLPLYSLIELLEREAKLTAVTIRLVSDNKLKRI